MTEGQRDEALMRLSEIDLMFAQATGWGSWMVGCANEREDLANKLRANGIMVAHKYVARCGGQPTD